MNTFTRIVAVVVLTSSVLLSATTALADGFIQYGSSPVYRPSNVVLNRPTISYFGAYCYNDWTGYPIDCEVDFKVLGLASVLDNPPYTDSGYPPILIPGGHTSEHLNLASRPLFYPNLPDLTYWNGSTTTVPAPGVEAVYYTNATESSIQYPLPEEAGLIAVQIDLLLLPGSGEFFDEPRYTSYDFKTVFLVQDGYWNAPYTGTALNKLDPIGPDHVIRLDAASTGHRDLTVDVFPTADPSLSPGQNTDAQQTLGDYLDNDSYNIFLWLAYIYHHDRQPANATQTVHRLAVNDASLPLGGLYDYQETWAPPHNGHRDGWAIDIDKTDETSTIPIDCDDNWQFHREVAEAMASVNPTHSATYNWKVLDCEQPTENYHVNFKNPTQ